MAKLVTLCLLLPLCAFGALNTPTNFRTVTSDFYDVDGLPGYILAQLKWTDNNTAETAYEIHISTNGTTFFLYATTAANAEGFDTALVPWTSNRWFKVRAVSLTDSSSFTVATNILGVMPPAGIAGSGVDATHVTISWQTAGPSTNASGAYVTGYKVYQDTNANFNTADLRSYSVAGQDRTSTNINFSFVSGMYYYFMVVAVCPTGEGLPIDKPLYYVRVAPNGPPSAPTYISEHMDGTAGEAVVLLDDTALNRAANGWIWRSRTNGASAWTTNSSPESGVTRQTWTASGLVGGFVYTNEVYASNSAGLSAATSWTFIPPATPSGTWHTFYVSTNTLGNGNFTGTNWANAWSGPNAINWSLLSGGDVVYLDGGASGLTYSNYLVTFQNGTYANRITIKTATNSSHNGLVTIAGQVVWKSDYVTIDGARDPSITNGYKGGITNNINLRVLVNATADPGIYMYHTVGTVGKWMETTGSGSPITTEGEGAGVQYGDFNGPTNAELAFIYIHDVYGNAVLGNVNSGYIGFGNILIHHVLMDRWHNNMMGGLGSSDIYNCWTLEGWKGPGVAHPDGPEGSPTYTRFWNCDFWNASPPSGNALNIGMSEDGQLYHDFAMVNCIFGQDEGDQALLLGHQGTPDNITISNCLVANNTFISRTGAVTFSFVPGSVNNWTGKVVNFYNNIFHTVTGSGGAALFSSGRLRYGSEADFGLDYNVMGGNSKVLLYRTNNADAVAGVNTFTTAEQFDAWSSRYHSNSSATPYFVSPWTHNVSLYGLDTNAIDQGTNLSSFSALIPAITNDINGAVRGENGRWDVGAYEYDHSLKMWWDFEQYSNCAGCIVTDMSGNTNNGVTVTNRFTDSFTDQTNYAPGIVTGRTGTNAVNFQLLGTNRNWVVYAENLGYNMGQWLGITNWNGISPLTNGTWMCWYMETNTAGPGDATLWGGGWINSPGDDNTWDVSRYNYDNLTFTEFTNSNRRAGSSVPNMIASNVWCHVAFSWNATNNSLQCYTNGVLAQSNTLAAPYLHLADNGVHNVIVGGSTHGGSYQLGDDQFPNNGWFAGYMDDLRIYNRELSATEIASIVNGGGSAPAASGGGGGGGGGTGGDGALAKRGQGKLKVRSVSTGGRFFE